MIHLPRVSVCAEAVVPYAEAVVPYRMRLIVPSVRSALAAAADGAGTAAAW